MNREEKFQAVPPLVGMREALDMFAPSVRPSADWVEREVARGRLRAYRIGRRLAFDLRMLRHDLAANYKNTN